MAFDYDGANSRLTGTITAMDSGDWTIAAWVNPRSAGEGSAGQIVKVLDGSSNLVQSLRLAASTRTVRVDQGATTTGNAVTSNTLPTNDWTLVVGTFRSSDASCHVFFGDFKSAMVEQGYASTATMVTRRTAGTTLAVGNDNAGTVTWDGRIGPVAVEAIEWGLAEMEHFRRTGLAVLRSSLRVFLPCISDSNDYSAAKLAITNTSATLTQDPPIPGLARRRRTGLRARVVA